MTFHPGLFATLKNQSNALMMTRQYTRAIVSLEASSRLQRDDRAVQMSLGDLYKWDGRPHEAAVAYRNAIRLEVLEVEAHRRLGDVLRELKQWTEAEVVYDQAVRLFPRDAELHARLGEIRVKLGNDNAGLDALTKAVALGWRGAEAYLQTARLLASTGRKEEALRLYAALVEADLEGLNSGLLTDAGLNLYYLGATAAAAVAYERALAHDADNVTARLYLGWCLYLDGDLDGAIAAYGAVLDREEDNRVARFNLALAYLARGEVDRAKGIYAGAMDRYGAAEAGRLGVFDDLRLLVGRSVQVETAGAIISTYEVQP